MAVVISDLEYHRFKDLNSDRKIIFLGSKMLVKGVARELHKPDYYCLIDEDDGELDNVINLNEIDQVGGPKAILLCIQQSSIQEKIMQYLMMQFQQDDMVLFDINNNPDFRFFSLSSYRYCLSEKRQLFVNIVCYEDGWILYKFATKLRDELTKLGCKVVISDQENAEADVNHFINMCVLSHFLGNNNGVRTTMITHVDSLAKRDLIAFQSNNGVLGICMSEYTMEMLNRWGIPRENLCYINPAHDEDIEPRKIVIGITNKSYKDLDIRKRESVITEVFARLDSGMFRIKIMGYGWDDTVSQLKDMGYEVEYHSSFDKAIYRELIKSLDYWMYYGFDEGAMGFLDALQAGVKTIATPQGFHLDVKDGLTYACSTVDEFIEVLTEIQNEKKKISDSIREWTWENYARKHLAIWHYLMGMEPLTKLFSERCKYKDGIYSMLINSVDV